jgi:hypothetical protein
VSDPLELDWRLVPAGPFTMGSDPAAEHAPDPDEAPMGAYPWGTMRPTRAGQRYAASLQSLGEGVRRPPRLER